MVKLTPEQKKGAILAGGLAVAGIAGYFLSKKLGIGENLASYETGANEWFVSGGGAGGYDPSFPSFPDFPVIDPNVPVIPDPSYPEFPSYGGGGSGGFTLYNTIGQQQQPDQGLASKEETSKGFYQLPSDYPSGIGVVQTAYRSDEPSFLGIRGLVDPITAVFEHGKWTGSVLHKSFVKPIFTTDPTKGIIYQAGSSVQRAVKEQVIDPVKSLGIFTADPQQGIIARTVASIPKTRETIGQGAYTLVSGLARAASYVNPFTWIHPAKAQATQPRDTTTPVQSQSTFNRQPASRPIQYTQPDYTAIAASQQAVRKKQASPSFLSQWT